MKVLSASTDFVGDIKAKQHLNTYLLTRHGKRHHKCQRTCLKCKQYPHKKPYKETKRKRLRLENAKQKHKTEETSQTQKISSNIASSNPAASPRRISKGRTSKRYRRKDKTLYYPGMTSATTILPQRRSSLA